jgi:hypothetical protein
MTAGRPRLEPVKVFRRSKSKAPPPSPAGALCPVSGKFRALCRRSWVAKESGSHRGIITRTAESVFEALLYLTEKYGRVFLSLEGLAYLAMCCKQSVVTALADLERLGFLTRIRRIRLISTPLGFTTRQITNAYRVHEPARGLGLIAMTLFTTESNSWTPSAANFHSKECSGDFRRVVVSRSLRNGAARWRSSHHGSDEQMFGAK